MIKESSIKTKDGKLQSPPQDLAREPRVWASNTHGNRLEGSGLHAGDSTRERGFSMKKCMCNLHKHMGSSTQKKKSEFQ